MKCPTCHGTGVVVTEKLTETLAWNAPCQECGGSGIASCCDAAGSNQMLASAPGSAAIPGVAARTFTCPRCGLTSHNPNDARERYCGACHAFVDDVG